MKQSILILTLLLTFGLISCNDDKESWDDSFVSDATREAQLQQFPEARNIRWEQQGEYLVAGFHHRQKRVGAWYDNIGNWYMTEVDYNYEELPASVKSAFQKTHYTQWKITDVDKVERQGREVLYVIQIERGKKEIKLHYTADGILVFKKVDVDHSKNHAHLLPTHIPNEIQAYLNNNHSNARIIHVRHEKKGYWKVKLVENYTKKELIFNGSPIQWFLTKWEISIKELPQTILESIENTEYSSSNGWKIDDIEQIETVSGLYYEVEFERGDEEVEIIFDSFGEVVKDANQSDNDIPSYPIQIPSEVTQYLDLNYPDSRPLYINYTKKGFWKVKLIDNYTKKIIIFSNSPVEWLLTKWDISVRELPQAVLEGINKTEYISDNGWRIDDIEQIETINGTYFEVEFERGKQEVEIIFDSFGDIVRDANQSDNDFPLQPIQVPEEVQQYLDLNHANAQTIHINYTKRGYWKAKLIENYTKKIIIFSDSPVEWLLTRWEISPRELPQAVLEGIQKTEYISANGWKIDDIELIKMPKGTFYEVEFEKGKQEVELIFNTVGELVHLDLYQ